MTNKERFYNNMKAQGLKVTATATTLVCIARNGKMETTYHFDEKGNFLSTTTKIL